MLRQSFYGNILGKNNPPAVQNSIVSIGGQCHGVASVLSLDEDILSRHMMLIGGTGCGKTNTFFHLVNQIKRSMTADDIMIVFDTKGDYYSRFYNSQSDYIISTASAFSGRTNVWNIFKEILLDGAVESEILANVSEISWGLFSDAIERNTSNPFFPNAARDLFASILTCMIRQNAESEGWHLNNECLRTKLNTMSAQDIGELLSKYPDQAAVVSYIGDGTNSQGMGVLAEMQTIIRKIFVGEFAKKGLFSVREFVRNKGAKTLFIEYDLARGSFLTPIYKLLIDLALKEAMSRENSGNVFVFCDEFKLLPNLQHIEDAVNFGRSLGVKIFAGLQSIDQLIENYGEARARNIIAGFSSVLSFKANDEETRKFTVGLYGKNYVLEQHRSISNSTTEEKRLGNVVEDWDICRLQRGEAIVGLPEGVPFVFKFDIYR